MTPGKPAPHLWSARTGPQLCRLCGSALRLIFVLCRRRILPCDAVARRAKGIGHWGGAVQKLQTQGVHHITLVGADRQTSIDFWEGVLGMPFIFDQPNLDRPDEGHLYFDPGDGRLITIFTNESRKPAGRRTSTGAGAVHHVAFAVSLATFRQAAARLIARGIAVEGPKDRGFMDSIYFEDPLGLMIELACYKFEPPFGCSHADVMIAAHRLRVARGDHHIAEVHLADAIEGLVRNRQQSLSTDRGAKNPYAR